MLTNISMTNKNPSLRKKGFRFLTAAILAALAINLEAVLLIAECVLSGSADLSGWSLAQNLIHWFLTCAAWGISSAGLLLLIKKYGFDVFSHNSRPSMFRLALILGVILAGILYMSFSWGFQFKPVVEWKNMMNRFGTTGVWAFLFQYLYYLFECLAISIITIAGQEAGECFFSSRAARRIPWGGIFCFLTWGMLHALSKDWNTAFFCLPFSLMFGTVYLLADKNIRYTYTAIALMFIV